MTWVNAGLWMKELLESINGKVDSQYLLKEFKKRVEEK